MITISVRILISAAGVLFLSLLSVRPAYPAEAGCGSRVTIDRITYTGDDTYRVTGSVSFPASADSPVKSFEECFFVQTETGWAPLQVLDRDAAVRPVGNVPGTPPNIDLMLRIPLNTPGLFRTYEGDISLMEKIRYECLDRGGAKSGMEEEILYWITPRTSKWILREGM